MEHVIHNKKQKGFTLIEMIIAIALLTFGIVAVYGSFASTAASTYNTSARFTAAYLGQEGLEIIRSIRDNNFNNPGNPSWDNGLRAGICDISTGGSGCMADYKTKSVTPGMGDTGLLTYNSNTFLALNQDGFYSYDMGGTPTIFKRKITISEKSPAKSDVISATVYVYWTYNGQSFNYTASTDIYNWK